MAGNNGVPGNLPIFDGKNWDGWVAKMRVLFRFQNVLEIVETGIKELGEGSTDSQRAEYKEAIRRDGKALFLIHQCVDPNIFEKIQESPSAKDAWDILAKCFTGGDKVRKVRLQSLRRQYELLQMEASERIADYFTRVLNLANQMKGCGEKVSDQMIIEKIMSVGVL